MTHIFGSAAIHNLISSAGLNTRTPVRVVATSAGTLSSDFESGDIVDGVTLATGDRILIRNQVDSAENGTYIVQATGAPVRDEDMVQTEDVCANSIWVKEGTLNANTGWVGQGIIGTNATFTRYDVSNALEVSRGGTGTTSLTANGILIGNGTSAISTKLSEFNKTSAPTINDDSDSGYSVGSRWIDTTANKEYICVDASIDTAIWVETTQSSGEITTASNEGVGGVGVFKQKTGVNLEFKNINSTSATSGIVITNDAGNDEVDVNLSINSLTTETSVQTGSDFALFYDTTASAHRKILIRDFPSTYTEVISTIDTSTSSTNYTFMSGMTSTPTAGKYWVVFSASGGSRKHNQIMNYALYNGDSIVPHSERSYHEFNFKVRHNLHTQAVIDISGLEAITVKYKTGSGTFYVFQRSLMFYRLSA